MTEEYRIEDGPYTHKLIKLSNDIYRLYVQDFGSSTYKNISFPLVCGVVNKHNNINRLILYKRTIKVGDTLIEREVTEIFVENNEIRLKLIWKNI